ncbi:MAG: nodulation protein NfeD, partial [Actinobacteria bacterium]|nr:nodulation protein NfeD [Actinomycetota bacterium]
MDTRRRLALRPPRWSVLLLLSALCTTLVASAAAAVTDAGDASSGGGTTVATTSIVGAITPVVADHLRDTIADAAEAGHQALLVTLDTPGGLVSSMRVIVQEFLNAPLPVIVHVAPSGADAGSAGTFITLSAHVAAMAPATTIGAATPVDLEGGEVGDKIV